MILLSTMLFGIFGGDSKTQLRGLAVLRSVGPTFVSFWSLVLLLYVLPTPLAELLRTSGRQGPPRTSLGALPGTVEAAMLEPPAAAEDAATTETMPSAGQPLFSLRKPTAFIEDPRGALSGVADKLRLTAAKRPGAVTRITHYGDSLIDLDHITSTLREIYQRRYGDAGFGFTPAVKPWRWYAQTGVKRRRSAGWTIYRLLPGRRTDGLLGLGGTAADSQSGKHWVRIWTTETKASQLEIAYLAQPGGGRISVLVDGQRTVTLHTQHNSGTHSAFQSINVPDGNHQLTIQTRGKVRLFGATLRRNRPGIIWDNLPLVGLRFHQLQMLDDVHWREQLSHHKPDLLIFQFGANDTFNYGGDIEAYRRAVSSVLASAHKALPDASCLVIGPLDRVQYDEHGKLRSQGWSS